MIAEILSTGDEIRTGSLVDSNSAYMARRLEEAGIEVLRHTTVGDDVHQLIALFTEVGRRSDIALVTGGLGPTEDDLSTEAAARAAGVELKQDDKALSDLHRIFEKLKRPMSPSNLKQVMLPANADPLYNPIGTAPGFAMKLGRCRFYFMPGVPGEMKRMLGEKVLPHIETLRGSARQHSLIKTIHTFGLPESATGEQLAGFSTDFPDIQLGLRAKFPEIQIKLYLRGENEARLHSLMAQATDWVAERMGHRVISTSGETMQEVVGNLLTEQKATLAVAESCTGGLISHWLTNVAGSSTYFLFSGVTYANEAKIKVLGVSPAIIEKHGAVHPDTAAEMAAGARRLSGATYAVATSGIAGPGGGTAQKPVGTLCVGLATPAGARGMQFHFGYGGRLMKKKLFAMAALDQLRRQLLNYDS